MNTAYEDLTTAIQTKIDAAYTAGTFDAEQKAEATIILTQWVSALEASEKASSTDVSSYSIGGRSVSRRASDAQLALANSLRRQLNQLLYGMVTEADFRTRSLNTNEYTIST